MSRPTIRLLLVPFALILALALAACGDDDSGGNTDEPVAGDGAEASAGHVHGLGVTPDETLYIATHSGLYSAPAGQPTARPVGESRQDIMGFSVVERNRFIGSGHPAPGQQLPPNLGLIESRDGGETWESVSLMGEVDFHVLESAGSQVYGFDATSGRLMVSVDGGRRWVERAPPSAMLDMAVDPRNPQRVVVATQTGLHVSNDAGKKWRALRDDLLGLLAWPSEKTLYLIDAGGSVQASTDGGRSWRNGGSIGGQPAAFVAQEGDLYAALGDGSVKRSTDGGASWSVRATP
jgi:hypothetical protein